MCPTIPAVPGIDTITCPPRRSVVAWPLPFVRDVVHLEAGRGREERREEMLAAAVARRRVVDLARALLHISDELGERLHGQRRIDDQHARLAADQRDGRKVLDGIVGELRVQRGADGIGLRREQQRVAVGRCAGDDLAADRRAGAGLVLDHDLLPEPLSQAAPRSSASDRRPRLPARTGRSP
jgi:hypothetical protein